jgi:hypothetical protein
MHFKAVKIVLLLLVLLFSRLGFSTQPAENSIAATASVSQSHGTSRINSFSGMPLEITDNEEEFSEKIGRQLSAALPSISAYFTYFLFNQPVQLRSAGFSWSPAESNLALNCIFRI